MSWVRFTADYDFKPTPATTVAFKAGMTQFVTRACATLAVAAGRAVRVNKKAEVSDAGHDKGVNHAEANGRRSIALPTSLSEEG